MRKAAELLRDSRLTVGVVSRQVGYRQQAQFAKAFRRQYGAAPAEYRRGVAAP
jgi:transcriptional regulator GlxA family with amidase domain